MRLVAGDRDGAWSPWLWLRLQPRRRRHPALSPRTRSMKAPARLRSTRRGTGAPAPSSERRGSAAAMAAGSSFDGTNDYVGLPQLGTFYNTALHARGLGAEEPGQERRRDPRNLGRERARCSGSTISPAATSSRSAAASPRYLDSGVNPIVGQWQHLAATFDGTTARYYIDGLQVASRAVSGSVGNSNTWRIGAYGSAPGGFFDGIIDELRDLRPRARADRDPGRPRPAARDRRSRRADQLRAT